MKSPLERAARALCALDGHPENATTDGKPLWMDYLPEARAVIGAIRDPSDEQVKAAADCENSLVADVYTAMIDSLLD